MGVFPLAELNAWWRRRRTRPECAGCAAPGLCGCGRRYRNATRGTGRTSRRNRRRCSPSGTQPRCVQTPIMTSQLAAFLVDRWRWPARGSRRSPRDPSGRLAFSALVSTRSDNSTARRCLDLLGGAVADEHRLALPLHGELGAFGDAADVDADRGQSLHVGGRVHLVDQRPDRGTADDDGGTGGRVVQEVAACALMFVCM